jgi:hypothetical protein
MALSVEKEVEKVRLSVKKAVPQSGAAGISMQVKLLADVSGSFQDEFQSGLVNPFFEAALCIAAAIDPDKVVQIVAFSDSAKDTGDYGIDHADTIVKEFLNRTPRGVLWSGTDYGCALNALIESNGSANPVAKAVEKTGGFFSNLFGGSKPAPAVTSTPATTSDKPWLNLFLSDGEDYGNRDEFMKKLKQLAGEGVFTVLIGANSDRSVTFSRLREAADAIDGVTFHRISDLNGCSTDDLYNRIFDEEFKNWYAKYMSSKAVAV